MLDVIGPGTTLGYCTNVHAGATLDAIRRNLEKFAVPVRDRVSPNRPMGVGLWLPAAAAREIRRREEAGAFGYWLAERRLFAFTMNGFPQGDFHESIVKHRVYRPNWATRERLEYTEDLLHVMAALLPMEGTGSISTLPVAWRGDLQNEAAVAAAGANLRAAVRAAVEIEAERGVLVHLDLEPEPGCYLDRAADVVAFIEDHVLDGEHDALIRRHLRVCHDVCHAAVMFERDADAFAAYERAGLKVGKVQLSSAVRVRFDALDDAEADEARRTLAAFGEERYLHQTAVREDGEDGEDGDDGVVTLHEDLPAALASVPPGARPRGEWRVHFHVPVFAERLGPLGTTRDELDRCLELCRRRKDIKHYEVETYAWNVLPEAFATDHLAAGIARELEWIADRPRAATGGGGEPRAAAGGGGEPRAAADDGGEPRAATDGGGDP